MGKRYFDYESIIEGAYYPGMHIIKLNKELHDNIKYEDFSKDEWSTMVHEYIHFIQDISLLHGLIQYEHNEKLVELYVYSLQHNAEKNVSLPIRLSSLNEDAEKRDCLLDFYEGDCQNKVIHHIDGISLEIDNISSEIIFGAESKEKLLALFLKYDDGNKYKIGNICLLESMAYLIEHHLFDAKVRNRELPYNACELVCKEVFPEILSEPQKIVMLCETALMFEDGGLRFYELLKSCKKENMMNKTDKDFEFYCSNIIKGQMHKYNKIYEYAYSRIDVLYPTNIRTNQVLNLHVKSYLECGKTMRNSEPLFISNIFKNNSENYIKHLLDIFEIPLLSDSNGYIYGPEGCENMPVVFAFLRILMRGERECPLKNYCENSGVELYDSIQCIVAPWKRRNDYIMCPICSYFVAFGIEKEFRTEV